ncbi:RrF2 family transcriptional regulator [Rhodococcus jostii]|uniref:Rrf2 family protein n=1 Tax=Rhodococcus jostii TaxID=132919 RepID=A0A1H5AJ18_RHOJO|nr:Rrf2 family transcriptional regulator [Rhodococcus jostii]TQC46501.1 Rrf2 family transcriptional regulator [Rhodococcus sp. WS4]SED42406.1 Rrf2 family protein [Rhodococcus jostii]
MKLSGGVEWSLHCCVVLSQAEVPVPTARLADLHGVSKSYLAKHLQSLARAGLVRPTEGRDGGYVLTRASADITVLDVVQAVDGTAPAFRCTEIRRQGLLAAPPEQCTAPCGIAKVMADAERAWRDTLSGVTIADLAATLDLAVLKQTLETSY